MMDKYDVTLYGVDSYTEYPVALTYRLEAESVGIAVDLARLAATGSYPEFTEDYGLYNETFGVGSTHQRLWPLLPDHGGKWAAIHQHRLCCVQHGRIPQGEE